MIIEKLSMKMFFALLLFGSLFAEGEKMSDPTLTGRVVYPKDSTYEKARLVSNYYPSKNKYPKVIVFCQNTSDVQNAVKWAKANNISVRIRSGGHNHEGFSTGSDAIIIDVSEMKSLEIDKANKIATIAPGVTGRELYTRLYKEGLTQAGGTCSDVGISGLVLTGGMGPLLRREGLTCDTLLSLEMVDAKGEILKVEKTGDHKDLFWASQGGGGGNFGVVTSIKLKVFEAPSVTWFNIGWDWSAPVDQIIKAWQNFFNKDDRRWFSHLDVWGKGFSVETFKKQPIKAMGVFYGTKHEAKKELAPLLKVVKPTSEMIEQVTWDRAIQLFEESTSVFVTDKPEYKSTSAFEMEILPEEALQKIETTLKNSKAPLINILFFTLGGRASEIKPDDTAYFYRQAKYFVCYTNQWMKENENIGAIKELDALRETLLPYADGLYLGNPDRNIHDYLTAYYGSNLERLRKIKTKYDPSNLFQHDQSITPLANIK